MKKVFTLVLALIVSLAVVNICRASSVEDQITTYEKTLEDNVKKLQDVMVQCTKTQELYLEKVNMTRGAIFALREQQVVSEEGDGITDSSSAE